MTGERILDPADVPDDLTITDMSLVGNYAIRIHFSDGHSTGIFSWTYLREIAPQPADPDVPLARRAGEDHHDG